MEESDLTVTILASSSATMNRAGLQCSVGHALASPAAEFPFPVTELPNESACEEATVRTVARAARPEYLFVNNVRFLGMFAIVYVHSQELIRPSTPLFGYAQVALLQFFKFGTIAFFLISGFLLGDGLTRGSRTQYFLRRMSAVCAPWFFWGMIWLFLALRLDVLTSHRLARGDVSEYLRLILFHSIYWFVPNFLLCLGLIATLYRRVPDRILGPVFLACSLFYGANIYLRAVPAAHTSALGGFVFYLWLGIVAQRTRERWMPVLERMSWTTLIGCCAAAGVLALLELHVLTNLFPGSDPGNTLRLSNQIFSVLVTLAIVKRKSALVPACFNVRSNTFGIYLIHPVVLIVVQALRGSLPPSSPLRTGVIDGPLALVAIAVMFASVYFGSMLLTSQIGKIPLLRWTLGK